MFFAFFQRTFFQGIRKWNIFSRKNNLKNYSTLKVFFPIQHWWNSNFNFSSVLHVNRVFYACIHDTNIIPECQSKHKLTIIILSPIVGIKYENNTLIIKKFTFFENRLMSNKICSNYWSFLFRFLLTNSQR